ncbi:MAG: hypothetical protein WCP21_03600, partial [Armatimonadota bacterium]
MPQLPQALKRATPPLVVFMLLGLAGNGGFSLSPALSAPAGAPRVEFLFAAPKDGSNEVLQDPVGIACDAGRARIYVGDTNHHRVAVFNTLGAFLYDFKHWIKAAGGDRTLGTPARLLPWDGGTVLVADTASGSLDIMD